MLIKERNISVSHQGQVMSAVKMFYASVIDQEDKIKGLFQPKKPQKLPKVLTEEEVSALLRSVDNLKHRCILMLIYSGGLRLGEVIALRLPDLQPEKERLFVRSGKGNKDRCTLLSEKAWEHLKHYIELYKPVEWVFEGPNGGHMPVQKLRKFTPMIYSTNWIERLNRDYKRTLKMRGVMPDSESVIFLLGKVSMTRTAYDRKVPKLDNEQKRFRWEEIDP